MLIFSSIYVLHKEEINYSAALLAKIITSKTNRINVSWSKYFKHKFYHVQTGNSGLELMSNIQYYYNP